MEALFEYSNRLISQVDIRFTRYLYDQINWDNRLIGLVGPRGVGKTTLVFMDMAKKKVVKSPEWIINALKPYFN